MAVKVESKNKKYFKGEMKADIINFSNIFFGKPNISKVKFVNYFFSFSIFLAR